MATDKSAPPAALICDDCFELQSTAGPAVDEFYCSHHHVWAIRRPDGGWLLSTHVSPEDHRALLEDARKLQAVDDTQSFENVAQIVH